jgi:hypothetical protein
METVTLTYAELAERLGVKDESARKTTQRRKWRKFMGNDGFTRVEVPLDELPKVEAPPPPPGPSLEEIIAGLREANARLEAERDLLREMLTRSDLSIADSKAMLERWQGEALKWQEEAGRWQAELKRVYDQYKTPRGLWRFWRRPNGKGD